ADHSASPAIRLEPDANRSRLLSRGAFLFVGGDTSCYIADYASLASRIQNPFSWAYNGLVSCGQQLDERPIFGLPGNHNYYDVIDGFNRQFRLPLTAEHVPNTAGLEPQLSLPGFKRQQRASYSALRLPFGWWFW